MEPPCATSWLGCAERTKRDRRDEHARRAGDAATTEGEQRGHDGDDQQRPRPDSDIRAAFRGGSGRGPSPGRAARRRGHRGGRQEEGLLSDGEPTVDRVGKVHAVLHLGRRVVLATGGLGDLGELPPRRARCARCSRRRRRWYPTPSRRRRPRCARPRSGRGPWRPRSLPPAIAHRRRPGRRSPSSSTQVRRPGALLGKVTAFPVMAERQPRIAPAERGSP